MQEGSTEEEEMKQQQRIEVMKDMTSQIRAKGRLDANNSWWVREQLAADCEKAWLHVGWEDILQKWYEWMCEMKKKDEAKWMEEEDQKKVSQMIKSADGSAGLGVERRCADIDEGRGRRQASGKMRRKVEITDKALAMC